jgi:hypothetical protein
VREIAYAGGQADRQVRGDEGPTPESVDRARTAQHRERAAFTRDTGVWVKPNGRMLHRTSGFGFHLPLPLRAFEKLPRSASRWFDGFPVQGISTLVH